MSENPEDIREEGESQVDQAREELIKSIRASVLKELDIPAQHTRRRSVPALSNNNYSQQVEFLYRVLELLEDPSVIQGPAIVRIKQIVQRRAAVLMAADKDYSVFEVLERFERAEALKDGGIEDDFIEVLKRHETKVGSERKASKRRETVFPILGKKQRFGPQSFTGFPGGNGTAAFGQNFGPPFVPFPPQGFNPFNNQGPSNYQPAASGACFNCGKSGHRARDCRAGKKFQGRYSSWFVV